MENITPNYPLQWPLGWPRTKSPTWSRFGVRNNKPSIYSACDFLKEEVRRLGGIKLVISTNLKYKIDGTPYSNQKEPDDKGVSIYFKYKNDEMALACDTFDRIGCNIYAIAKTIESMRAIERYGCSELLNKAFSGFKALPPPPSFQTEKVKEWWEIIGCSPDAIIEDVVKKYKEQAKIHHPDAPGGNEENFKELNNAYQQALAIKNK